ncbi:MULTISPECIES: metallophosphoesterase family protein [Bacillus]|uniref:DNA repair exonuclease n=1 Tax=Bacillus pseudomycoides TaxID=64104 RepID=A0A1Y3MD20_9BACI|nr:DNA repair exonuclease [Bacillus pseudomycoides]EOP57913.1 DNA repair exonuclease [Bacillus cereus VD136]EOP75538.1 DNA repair exonuclease [Bacillus cereus VDM006]MDF2086916.1 DNA repair exonuclease [Bacillus pseudomycoides]OUM48347.1 DNA repair exonuclease [Bacillus pseudomycoides]
MKQVKFIHAADLHLDSPFKGMEMNVPSSVWERMKQSTFQSFERIIDKAIQERVDFVLLAGDLYDAETRSLRAQVFVREQMKRLSQYEIPVYIIHGNHDHLGGSWAAIEFPENVHVFAEPYVEEKPFYKDGELLASIYGFSYLQQAVTDNMTAQYAKMSDAPFHIGMLHGSVEGDAEHNRYAPFQIRELKEKGFDYWALGHIHKREILAEEPYIIYPGNIQGRHRKETGEKGAYLVEITEQGTVCSFFGAADVVWGETEISIDELQTVDDLMIACTEVMNEWRQEEEGTLLTVVFIGQGPLSPYLRDEKRVEEIFHILAAGEERRDFVYVMKWKNETVSFAEIQRLKKENHFVGSVLQELESFTNMDTVLRTIWTSSVARNVIESFSDEEKAEIQKEAENIILEQLFQQERDKK